MNKVCIILVGLPASGKSIFRAKLLGMAAARQQQIQPYWNTISTDDLVEAQARTFGKTYSEVWKGYIDKAQNISFAQLKYAVDQKDHVIVVDRTHLSKKAREKIINMVKERDPEYKFVCFNFHCNLAEQEVRLANRPGKEIPESAMIQMKASYQAPSLDEGFDFIQNVNTTKDLDKVAIESHYNVILNMLEGKEPHNYRG